MSLLEKRKLIDEIESLPQSYYEEVLAFVQFLKQKKGLTILADQHSNIDSQSTPVNDFHQSKRSLMELQGLGKELWQNIDVDAFLEEERNAWV